MEPLIHVEELAGNNFFLAVGLSLMNIDSGIACHLSDSTSGGTHTS